MKTIVFINIILLFFLLDTNLCGQSLTLQKAYQMAEDHYPLMVSKNIYQSILEREHALINHSHKPQVVLRGETSFQSESVTLGGDIPNSPINIDVPLYRAHAYGELIYDLYDGGLTAARKHARNLTTLVNQQELLVNLYPLRDIVNQLFVAILSGRAYLSLYNITAADLVNRKKAISAGVSYGTILETELRHMEVRELELAREKSAAEGNLYSAYATLSVLLDTLITHNTQLITDIDTAFYIDSDIIRPEEQLFKAKRELLVAQEEIIVAEDKPYIKLFAQAGAGYPNKLDFTKINFAPFGIAGVQFSYKLWNKKDLSIKTQKLELQRQLIDANEETFRHNLRIKTAKYKEEVHSLQNQISQWEEIALIQADILIQMQAQLVQGVITVTDYLIQSNAELKARQQVELTKIILLQKQLEYQYFLGQKTQRNE